MSAHYFLSRLLNPVERGRARSAHRRIDSGEGGAAAAALRSLSFRSARSSPARSLSAREPFLSSIHFIPNPGNRPGRIAVRLENPPRAQSSFTFLTEREIAMLQTRDLIWTVLLFGHAGKDAMKVSFFFFLLERCFEGIQLLNSFMHRFGPDAVLSARGMLCLVHLAHFAFSVSCERGFCALLRASSDSRTASRAV